MRLRKMFVVMGVAAIVLVGVWSQRIRIADNLVGRRLARADVPASYRITRIGPFLERLEDVRIGDPAAPDLTARRIDVTLGFGLSGPFARSIVIQGARLRAHLGSTGLSLGSIDRLIPASRTGGAVLPDLGVTLRDARVHLDTPNGALEAKIEGSGNPSRRFHGTAKVAADFLRVSSCGLARVTADLDLTARSGAPAVAGSVRIGQVRCPDAVLGRGVATVALSSDPMFRKVALRTDIGGFGGRAGPVRFDRMSAHASGSGVIGNLDGDAELTMYGSSLPAAANILLRKSAPLAGTPIAPTAARARAALARLFGSAQARASMAIRIRGRDIRASLRRLVVTGDDGAWVILAERGGMRWSAAGLQADGDVTTGGGALPTVTVALRQAAPGAPLDLTGALGTYRADSASLAAAPIRARWDDAGLHFDAAVIVDGPVGSGAVSGLSLPIDGQVNSHGAVSIGGGCRTIALRALRFGSYTFGPARTELCGRPIAIRDPSGHVRIDAATGAIRLAGSSASGGTATLTAARLRFTGTRFSGDEIEASVGTPDRMTRLSVWAFDGDFRQRGVGGAFERGSAAIANVPLQFAEAAGSWSLDSDALELNGNLQIRDPASSPRFLPIDAASASVRLDGGTVTARADLVEPQSRALVAKVDIDHQLANGSGHALMTVPGIRFVPKGLQPEGLTPLTLGIIADVAGTVSGKGKISWGDGRVTSTGTFATDRIDLAAAFGPVTGIKGVLRFTDLLGLVSAPNQEATIAEINPGVIVDNGVIHYELTGGDRVKILDAKWPFAGGTLKLEPSILDFGNNGEKRLIFRVVGLDAAAFVQQLAFPNISATGIFDGKLPIVFDQTGGRIEAGSIVARPGGGSIAYVGDLSNAELGTMGKLAFDALKAIRYSSLDIALDGRLDGEMVSRVRFTGVREATPEQSLVTRLIRNLPFRFNIEIRAPFRGLVGSARSYIDPSLLLKQLPPLQPEAVQPPASGTAR